MQRLRTVFRSAIRVWALLPAAALIAAADATAEQPVEQPAAKRAIAGSLVGPHDWPMWGGSPLRNNTPEGRNLPVEWDVESLRNIKWRARLGSQTYGNPVVANGRVFVGTNNGNGYLQRFPPDVDLGVLLCFDEETGEFLWQYSSRKLPTGRVHDWPLQGICSTPVVDGDQLWFTTNRCEIVCLDADGFRDGENDGSFQDEEHEAPEEADVIWKFDMMQELGVSPHNMSTCTPICVGDVLFINTSNGVDSSHLNIPAPGAPSFMALDRNTAEMLWTDNSPGANILHGQWSSPSYAVLGGVPQVLFAGGDGWLYSFRADKWQDKRPILLWKFDCNPKTSKWILGGRGSRNNIVAYPVIYEGLVYVAVGQDPEHGEGRGHLWCIDPAKKLDGSDVSPELAVDADGNALPHSRVQVVNPAKGDQAIPNPDSAAVWHYSEFDLNGDGKIQFEETFHRSIGIPAIKDGVLYISDFSGLFHCVDAKTGQPHWTYDMFAAAWGSAVVVDGKVYIGDEDGEIAIFRHSADPEIAMQQGRGGGWPKKQFGPVAEIYLENAVYGTPVVANNVLYIANKNTLYAISSGIPGTWPQWRGPHGNGVSRGAHVPVKWSRDENVVWRTPLPGPSGATPIVSRDRVFVESADGDDLLLIGLDTQGEVLWRRPIGAADRVTRGETYIVAPSPVTDGEHVWAINTRGMLYCFDVAGKPIWSADLEQRYGKLQLTFGLTSTPVVDQDSVFLQLIHGDGDPSTQESLVVVLDKETGRERWQRVRRTDARHECEHSYASPIMVDGVLLTHGADCLVAYWGSKELWRCRWNTGPEYDPTLRQIASPAAAEGIIVVPTAKNQGVLALRPGGRGDITGSQDHVLWRRESNTPDVASPLIHDGLVYLHRENGMLLCLELKTGAEVYHEQIHTGRSRSSPVVAGEHIYLSALDGTVTVVKGGREFQVVARNSLDEQLASSPALSGGRIYLRTADALWAIGEE